MPLIDLLFRRPATVPTSSQSPVAPAATPAAPATAAPAATAPILDDATRATVGLGGTSQPQVSIPVGARTSPLGATLANRATQSPAATHAAKIDQVVSLVTKESMLETLMVLCKDPIMGPREASTPEYLLAAKWVAHKLELAGCEPLGDVKDGKRTFLQFFKWDEAYVRRESTSANVVGVLKGTGPEPRKAVVLSAHLDNLSKAEKDHYTNKDGRDLSHYEGANDNTASVAILLDTIAAMKAAGPFQHDVVVFVPSAEEDYLMGASAFALSPPVPLDRMIANVNLEMPGHGKLEDVYVYGGSDQRQTDANPLYARALRNSADTDVPLKHGLTIDKGEGWFARQDGLIFHNAGIPNILLQGGAAEGHYHTDMDTVEDLNMAKVEVLGRHTARIVADLADDPAPREQRGPVRGSLNPSGRKVAAMQR